MLTGAALGLAVLAGCGSTPPDAAAPTPEASCEGDAVGPGALVAFAVADGSEGWRRCLGEASVVGASGAAIVVLGPDGALEAVDGASGEVLWSTTVERGPVDPPHQAMSRPAGIVSGSTVVVLTNALANDVVGLDAATGAERWRVPVADDSVLAPVLEQGPGGEVLVRDLVVDAVPIGQEPMRDRPVVLTLDPATGAHLDPVELAPGIQRSGSGELVVDDGYRAGRQEITLSGRGPDGAPWWTATVPGFSAQLVGGDVLVTDQTGGTGVMDADPSRVSSVVTTIRAYDLRTGEQRWETGVPGTPQGVAPTPAGIGVADGTEVRWLDPTTGAVRWTADHGSPGEGGRWSEPGTYRWFGPGGDRWAVGFVAAEEPYRD